MANDDHFCLQLSYLDLYLVHAPASAEPGPTIKPPLIDQWRIMESLHDKNQHHGEPARRGAPLTAGKPGMHYVIEKINVMESLHDRVPSLIID
eukprot:scaffold74057_cov20-Tisochrysis_lutea.AAC.1